MKTFIVVPVYNETKQVIPFLKKLESKQLPVVVVNDGSNDGGRKKLESWVKKGNKRELVNHSVNLGKGAALKTGSIYAFKKGADSVIYMDSDGQHDPEDLDTFLEKLDEGFDVIIGSRNLGFGVPLDRYIGNKIASVIVALLFNVYVSDLICGYRALTKKAFEKLNWESAGYGVEVEMVVKMRNYNLKHCEVPVQTIYYDGFKGVSFMDAFSVFGQVIKWKFKK